jgi:hypothetical protein
MVSKIMSVHTQKKRREGTQNAPESQNSLFVNAYRNASSIFRRFSAIPANNMIPDGFLLGSLRLLQDLEVE